MIAKKIEITFYENGYCEFNIDPTAPVPLADAIKAHVKKEVQQFYKKD